jgi:hypothetical protein
VRIFERTLTLPTTPPGERLLDHLERTAKLQLDGGLVPNRFVITSAGATSLECEVGGFHGPLPSDLRRPVGLFEFVGRRAENCSRFNAVLLVPTGIGALVGGHAGDAGPVARLLASACDVLVTHPNVVNASDINEIPDNALYVEGSVLTRFLMGTVGLQPVRGNRVLVVMDAHKSTALANATVNAVNAARATYGLVCPKVVMLDPPLQMKSTYNVSGRASGEIRNFRVLLDLLRSERPCYDAVALTSVIQVPENFHKDYFDLAGDMVNPWGGVEALLTHTVSTLLDVPSAHSPMFESEAIANADPGIVEPRMAPEAISLTFLQCVLKGLQRSPRIVDCAGGAPAGVLTASDVSCLVIPEGTLGLPTIAALEQQIPVIAVAENANLMQNDLSDLPWRPGQFFRVANYWEAAGVMTALRAGIEPRSVRRPIEPVAVVRYRSTTSDSRPYLHEKSTLP